MADPITLFIATTLGSWGAFGAAAFILNNFALVAGAVKFGLAYGLSRLTNRDDDAGPQESQLGQTPRIFAGSSPVVIGYGEHVVGGVVQYPDVDNKKVDSNNNGTLDSDVNDLHLLYAHLWREGGIESIEGFYLNDDYVPNTPAHIDTEGVRTGKWGKSLGNHRAVYVKSGDGTQTGRGGPHLLAETFNQWAVGGTARAGATPIGAGEGLVFSHWRFRSTEGSQELFSGGAPDIRARLKLAKVYDPRKDGTRSGVTGTHRVDDPSTWEWSDNPALAYADYHTQYAETETDRIDWDNIADVADFCDEMVPIPGGTEKRFSCNVVLDGDRTHENNIGAIMNCMGARQRYTAGKYSLVPPRATAAAHAFDESNVVGDVQLVGDRSMREEITTVNGQIRSRDDDYEEVDFPSRTDSVLQAELGRKYERNIPLPGVTNHLQAQRLANLLLEEQRMRRRIVFPCNWEGIDLRVGDRFTLEYDQLDLTASDKWRITEMDFFGNDAPVVLYAVEDEDNVHDDMAVVEYHTFDRTGAITRGVNLPGSPEEFTASPTLLAGEILWSWENLRSDYDLIRLYTSTDEDWDNAVLTWEGKATQYLQTGIEGDSAAARTRYGWVRTVKGGVESDRTPDNDVSDVTASARSVGNLPSTALVTVFKRSATPPAETDRPTGNATWTFATSAGVFDSGAANGWSFAVPSGNDPLYSRSELAIGTGTTVIIEPADWGPLVGLGTQGPSGASFGIVELWTTTDDLTEPEATTLPENLVWRYNPPGVASGLPAANIWKGNPALAGVATGKYLWRAIAAAAGTTATQTLARTDFTITLHSRVGIDGAGQDTIFRLGTHAERTAFLADKTGWSGLPNANFPYDMPTAPWVDDQPDASESHPVVFSAVRRAPASAERGDPSGEDDMGTFTLFAGYGAWHVNAWVLYGRDGAPGVARAGINETFDDDIIGTYPTWESLRRTATVSWGIDTTDLSLITYLTLEIQVGDVLNLYWSAGQWVDYVITSKLLTGGNIVYGTDLLESQQPDNPTFPGASVRIGFSRAPSPIVSVPVEAFIVSDTEPTTDPGRVVFRLSDGAPLSLFSNSWLGDHPSTNSNVWRRRAYAQGRLFNELSAGHVDTGEWGDPSQVRFQVRDGTSPQIVVLDDEDAYNDLTEAERNDATKVYVW